MAVSGRGGGVCLPREGVSVQGGVCLEGYTPRGQTDACESISFPQLLLRTVKIHSEECEESSLSHQGDKCYQIAVSQCSLNEQFCFLRRYQWDDDVGLLVMLRCLKVVDLFSVKSKSGSITWSVYLSTCRIRSVRLSHIRGLTIYGMIPKMVMSYPRKLMKDGGFVTAVQCSRSS